MEILQTIWTAISTPNPTLIYIFNTIGFPFTLIEATVTMLLFTTVLKIDTTKKNKITYVLVIFFLSMISNTFIPRPYGPILHIIITPILIKIFFKTTLLKSIVAELLPLIVIVFVETIFINIYSLSFNVSYDIISTVPIYRETLILAIYLTIYLLHKILAYLKLHFSISSFESITRGNKILLLTTFVLAIVFICVHFYLIQFYINNLTFGITLLAVITLVAYVVISIYSLIKTMTLESVNQDLEQTKLYNNSLQILHDNIRSFKHDFANIVQSIGGYIDTNDIEGLKKYYSQLLEDCGRVNNLSTLNPDVINHPAVYSLLTAKYHEADELGIKINLQIFINLNELNMKIYEFTRILGILLDNAIEAASECEEKIINLEIRKHTKPDRQILVIENTYSNKDIDTERIFEKGYTSKTDDTKPHGLGLWEVKQILKKNKNLDLFTTKNDTYFSQKFTIYCK